MVYSVLRALALTLMLAVVIAPLSACTEEQLAQQEYKKLERQRKKAMTDVSLRASEYMLAVRWHDFQAASAFYEDVADQVSFLESSTSPAMAPRVIESYTVDYVLVDESRERAEVRLTLREINPTTQILETRNDTLLWFLSDRIPPKQWYLVPVTVLRPE